ncbi:hypothetical protein L1987_55992 [Smallanthus sonchifolius]|uniref:Uncharacterized protein n=1 Tax=Smallanthus sonchifolius TaxID=185202 RepID=A0ACB9ECL1_9ASTR|nr:hypothetical protein L1987_55992 [Smallanthus sonchifolius]
MDSGSHAAGDGVGGRSGGKIVKRRQIAARKTPYDRPTPPLQPENPNWLNVLVSPARFVAGGAGKLISSIWNPKSWGSNSSSSESDSDSEGGIEDDYECDENLHDGGAELNQNKGSSSGKSEILYLVEQLLMLKRFSREECDRLVELINLRVVDYTMREGADAGPNNPNISNRVIMEARKMITENTVGSSLKSDLDNSIRGSKSILTPNRDYHSGGSWNIQNEMQWLHSKAIALMKPNQLFSLEAPKPGNETVNMDSKGWFFASYTRTTQDHVPTEALSPLPIIEEKYQIAEKKDKKDDKTEGNLDMITEYVEVADVTNASQGSSNTNGPTSTYETDSPTVKQAATRTRKYNTRRGRPRGK